MYREPMLDEKENAQMAKRIELEMVKKVEQVADESQSDNRFMANLQDLIQLNWMIESHLEPKPPNDRGQACRPEPSNLKQTGESASPAPTG